MSNFNRSKESFPDINALEKEINNENQSKVLSFEEEKKFRYFSPVETFDFSQRKMFWSSPLEIFSRILIMVVEILVLILFGLFINFFLLKIVNVYVNTSKILFLSLSIKAWILILVLVPCVLLSLIFFIPMSLSRTAGSIHSWAIAYIIIAIFYFLLMESCCAGALIFESITAAVKNLNFSHLVFIFLIIFLVVSALWILASSFLIVKSDDIKKQISLEV